MKQPGKKQALGRHHQGLELPVVNETLCSGCGMCPEVCPTSCLAMGPHLPWLPRPADCVGCSLCVLVCPVDALRMEARG
jgi:MinD superfamily P-loop ATPase